MHGRSASISTEVSSIDSLASVIDSILDSPEGVIGNVDAVKTVLSSMALIAAAGTVPADFAAYLDMPLIALTFLSTSSFAGFIRGVYVIGDAIKNNPHSSHTLSRPVRKFSETVCSLINRVTSTMPHYMYNLFRKATVYSAIVGMAGTVIADMISNVCDMQKFEGLGDVKKYLCCGVLIAMSVSGMISGICKTVMGNRSVDIGTESDAEKPLISFPKSNGNNHDLASVIFAYGAHKESQRMQMLRDNAHGGVYYESPF